MTRARPRRPRLTAKVIRGLLDVHSHALADLESMSGDLTRDKTELDEMGHALEWIEATRRWWRATHGDA